MPPPSLRSSHGTNTPIRRRVRRESAALALLLLTICPTPTLAQAVEPPSAEEMEAARTAPLFSSNELLELTLEADFHAIVREDRKDEDSKERPATLTWTNPDGTTENREIQVQTRGNFRLQRRNCDIPPLRLNLETAPTDGTVWEGQEKLKLVGICKVRQDYWEQYVVAEYLTYRTFNLLTDLSFRVRPARVTYVDTSAEEDTFTRFAFLIEDDSPMAARNGGQKHDWERGQLDPRLLEHSHAILVDFFQYMIGNTDWSGVEMHNMELFRHPNGQPSTVPYDFDFSGIVDARYAVPDQILGLRSVRNRRFRGFCPDQVNRSPESYDAVVELFREKREEVYGLWRNQEGLSEEKLRESLEYFDEFYEILDDPEGVERYMMQDCRSLHVGR